MDFNTLKQVHDHLLEKATTLDTEIEKYRIGDLVDDEQYGRLVYKQSGMMSCVLSVNNLMSEVVNELTRKDR